MRPDQRQRIQQRVAKAWMKFARTSIGHRINQTTLHLALAGLGYNLYLDGETSGESWFIAEVLPRLGVRNAVDIGANVGLFSSQLLRTVPGNVYACEPGSAALPALRGLAQQNPDRLIIVECAMADEDGTRTFYVSDASSTWSSLHPEVDTEGTLGLRSTETVTVRRLDGLIEAGEIEAPDFIKVDVEGAEYEALRGASRTLAAGQVRAIQFEFNSHQLAVNHTLRDLSELMPGYELFRITAGRLEPVDASRWTDNIFQYCNIVAVRADLVATLASVRS